MASSSDFGYNIGEVLTENLDDLIFILNENFECEFVNEKIHKEKLGYLSLRDKLTVILHHDDLQLGNGFLQRLLKNGHAIEQLRVRQQNIYVYYEFKGKTFRNAKQEIKLLITSRDISQFKQSEEKYRHLFESSPYAIWIIDLNGVLIDCNATTNLMLSKYTREDILGKNFVEVLGLFDRPEYFIPLFKGKFESFVQGKKMKALELKMTRSDGIEKWINLRSTKITLGEETLIQVLIQDIT